jgi:hypothetical protein
MRTDAPFSLTSALARLMATWQERVEIVQQAADAMVEVAALG